MRTVLLVASDVPRFRQLPSIFIALLRAPGVNLSLSPEVIESRLESEVNQLSQPNVCTHEIKHGNEFASMFFMARSNATKPLEPAEGSFLQIAAFILMSIIVTLLGAVAAWRAHHRSVGSPDKRNECIRIIALVANDRRGPQVLD